MRAEQHGAPNAEHAVPAVPIRLPADTWTQEASTQFVFDLGYALFTLTNASTADCMSQ